MKILAVKVERINKLVYLGSCFLDFYIFELGEERWIEYMSNLIVDQGVTFQCQSEIVECTGQTFSKGDFSRPCIQKNFCLLCNLFSLLLEKFFRERSSLMIVEKKLRIEVYLSCCDMTVMKTK